MARQLIIDSEPNTWKFYRPADSVYLSAHPVAHEILDGVEHLYAHTNVSRKSGKQYEIDAVWNEKWQDWVIVAEKCINK